MELDVFLKSLIRRWYVPLTLVALAVLGVWMYHNITGTNTAEATVVVLDPLRPEPGEYVSAQINFNDIDESDELAERVAARLGDGTSADAIRGRISIAVKPSRGAINRSPLYVVRANDDDAERAKLIANYSVEEARLLFVEYNQPGSDDVRAGFAQEIADAEAAVAGARMLHTAFMKDNDAYALPQRVAQQISLLAQLRVSSSLTPELIEPNVGGMTLAGAKAELNRLQAMQPELSKLAFESQIAHNAVSTLEGRIYDLASVPDGAADAAMRETDALLIEAKARADIADGAVSEFAQRTGVANLSTSVQSQQALVNNLVVAGTRTTGGSNVRPALAEQQAELDRLTALQPDYDRLNLEVERSEADLTRLEERVTEIVASRALPAETQVRTLRDGELTSGAWLAAITYAVAVLLAILASLTIVYLVVFIETAPPTIHELERVFGQPVIARVPKIAG